MKHVEEFATVCEDGRVEASVFDAAPLGVALGVKHGEVELLIRFREQLAHPAMREAEDRLEVAALRHLPLGDDLVAVLRAVDVGPEQSAQRVHGGQAVARGDREWAARRQVDPVEVAGERDVCGGRAERDLLRQFPVRVSRLARAEFAIDLSRFEAARLVEAKEDARAERAQSRVMFVAVEQPEVPLVTALGRTLDVASVGTRHRDAAQVDGLAVLLRQAGRRE